MGVILVDGRSRREIASDLDKAFIFLLGTVSLTFGALNAIFGGPNALLFFLPLLISGVYFPFYVGYIQGAISSDSDPYRVRGWIYFSVGSAMYAGMLVDVIIRDFVPAIADFAVLIVFMICGAGYLLSYRLVKWVIKVLSMQLTGDQRTRLFMNGFAAMSLSAAFFFVEEYLRLYVVQSKSSAPMMSIQSSPPLLPLLIPLMLGGLFIFIWRKLAFKENA